MLTEISAHDWKNNLRGYTALFISSPFCQTCALAEQMVEQAREIEAKTTIYKINLQLAPEIATEYKVQSVPMLLLFYGHQLVARLSPLKHTGHILHFLINNRDE
ncbi:thioredoxin-like negative regulator of GroEL [Geomicrobium halophilum]|uniref:Thioredoxin-like negative regulator of GroEL n=1 Tax=Geomicrobium halophilum TaxID=549000 RepID=A0A841PMW9_9BACL|nr:thioredoxin family protein [Geomicrobium halophilum]MBB6449084.1 thioredoxin-like negative regulator of GroEL [Geomicrobium halophilum]